MRSSADTEPAPCREGPVARRMLPAVRLVMATLVILSVSAGVARAARTTVTEHGVPAISPVTSRVVRGRPFVLEGMRCDYSAGDSVRLILETFDGATWSEGGRSSVAVAAGPLVHVRDSVGSVRDLVVVSETDSDVATVTVRAPRSGIRVAETTAVATVVDGVVSHEPVSPAGVPLAFTGSPFGVRVTPVGGSTATVINAPVLQRDALGRLAAVFCAATGNEFSPTGAMWVRHDDREPMLLQSVPGLRVRPTSPLVPRSESTSEAAANRSAGATETPDGFCGLQIRRDASGDTSVCVYATDSLIERAREVTTLAGSPGFNHQAYSLIRLTNGDLLAPVVFAPTAAVFSGPWYMTLYCSSDEGTSWAEVAAPVTVPGRGILEPTAVELASGSVALLYRTTLGRVGRIDYDPSSRDLSEPTLTALVAPSAGLDARRMADGSIVVAWQSCLPAPERIDLPRKTVAIAVSTDELATFDRAYTVCDSASIADPMESLLPYVHQPRLAEIDGHLVVALERVITTSRILSYLYEPSLDLTPNLVRAGAHAVRLRFERLEAGRWVTHRWVDAPLGDSESATESPFSVGLSLPMSGTWRVSAGVGEDGLHAAGSLSPQEFTVARAPAIASLSAMPSVRVGSVVRAPGFISPRHTAWTNPVRVEFYRYEGGRWVRRATKAPGVYNATGGSRFSATYRIGLKGAWKVRAVLPGDSVHVPAVSAWRRFNVY